MVWLLVFVLVPLVELWVIAQVSGAIGLGWTLLVLFGDGIAGAVLVKHQGRRAWQAFRRALEVGRWPGDEVVQGALVLVGGALLLTPGFVTDVVGLAFVVPPTRALVSAVIRNRLTPGPRRPFRDARSRRQDGEGPSVLDVEVLDIERDNRQAGSGDEQDDPRDGSSGELPGSRP